MASKTEIANRVLTRLAITNLITDLDIDPTFEARTIRTVYDQVVDKAIVAYTWSASTFKADLARTTETPLFGFEYEFQLPVDPKCLRVWAINDESNTIAFKTYQNKLYCDETEVQIEYSGRLTNADSFGVFITEAIVFLLLSECCFMLTGNKDLQKYYDSLLGPMQRDLFRQDNQRSTFKPKSTSYIDVR